MGNEHPIDDGGSLTVVEVGAYSERSRFRIGRTSQEGPNLGPVLLATFTGRAHIQHHLEVGEACALIAALQLVVDDVEREGREEFDQHVEGKLAETKFLEMPVSEEVSTDAC